MGNILVIRAEDHLEVPIDTAVNYQQILDADLTKTQTEQTDNSQLIQANDSETSPGALNLSIEPNQTYGKLAKNRKISDFASIQSIDAETKTSRFIAIYNDAVLLESDDKEVTTDAALNTEPITVTTGAALNTSLIKNTPSVNLSPAPSLKAPDIHKNNIIKSLKNNVSAVDDIVTSYVSGNMADSQNQGYENKLKLELSTEMTAQDVYNSLIADDPNVIFVQPDYELNMSLVDDQINDNIPNQGILPGNNTDLTPKSNWNDFYTKLAQAQSINDGTGVVVALIDGGLETSHPAIAEGLFHNPNEIPGNGVDDDNNGYADDVTGWDFFNNDDIYLIRA